MEAAETGRFEYNYSAKKQEEIERIKSKYVSYQDETLEKMRSLDRQAEKNASKQPILIGSIGAVLLALGMCGTLALSSQVLFAIGVVVGVVGIALIAVAYPLYMKKIREERAKVAGEILELAEQAGE